MGREPLITVVIPAYNREATIERCIGSVLTQDFTDFEIVVADDGSTDRTREIVSSHPDPRVRLVVRPANGGAAAARNTGVKAARADHIALLDSDDIFLPGKLSRQYTALKNAPSDTRMSCSAYRIELLDQGKIIDSVHTPGMAGFEGLYQGCSLGPGATLMCGRQVFDDIGYFDTSLQRFEDWEWLLRYTATGGRILLLNELLSYVYNRRGRLSGQTWESAETFIAMRDRLYPDIAAAKRREANFSIWSQVAGTAYYAGDKRTFAAATVRATRQDPMRVLRNGSRFLLGRSARSMSDAK